MNREHAQDLFGRILARVRDFDRLGFPRGDLLAWKLYPSHPSFAFVAGVGSEDLPDGGRLLVAPWQELLEVLDAIDHELAVELHTPPADASAVWFAVTSHRTRGRGRQHAPASHPLKGTIP